MNDNLIKAAKDHVEDIGPKGECGHDGSDGSTPSERIERYVQWDKGCCENIDFGSKNAVDVIMSLIIDDGVDGRGHRENIFTEEIKHGGIYCGTHTQFGTCTVCVYMHDIGNSSSGSKTGAKVVTKGKADPSDKVKNLFGKMDLKKQAT